MIQCSEWQRWKDKVIKLTTIFLWFILFNFVLFFFYQVCWQLLYRRHPVLPGLHSLQVCTFSLSFAIPSFSAHPFKCLLSKTLYQTVCVQHLITNHIFQSLFCPCQPGHLWTSDPYSHLSMEHLHLNISKHLFKPACLQPPTTIFSSFVSGISANILQLSRVENRSKESFLTTGSLG